MDKFEFAEDIWNIILHGCEVETEKTSDSFFVFAMQNDKI